jgi:hypothetical protein
MAGELGFDFEFEKGFTTADALNETRELITGGLLGGGKPATAGRAAQDPDDAKALDLLDKLDDVLVEFGETPELVQLTADLFEKADIVAPTFFEEMTKDSAVWWLRLPMTLKPYPGRTFDKFQCGIDLSSVQAQTSVPVSRPKGQNVRQPTVLSALPNKKVRELAKATGKVDVSVGANVEFQASVPEPDTKVEASAAAKAGLIMGPFEYTITVRDIDHSTTGTEKMFWTIESPKFFDDEAPSFVVILRVPNESPSFSVSAAMQAYHETDFLEQLLGRWFSTVSEAAERWLKMGAPSRATKSWTLGGATRP